MLVEVRRVQAEVVDRLHEIGVAVGLPEEVIQDAVADAVANPFNPAAAKVLQGGAGKVVDSSFFESQFDFARPAEGPRTS
jgi:hypothetical protein